MVSSLLAFVLVDISPVGGGGGGGEKGGRKGNIFLGFGEAQSSSSKFGTRGGGQRSSVPARRDSRRNIIHDRLEPTTRKTERNEGRVAFVIAEMMAQQHQQKKKE